MKVESKRRRSSGFFWASLKLAQVVVEGLDVGEDTHGVWFTTHDHHVVHLDQPVAARLRSGDADKETQVREEERKYVSTATQPKQDFA